MTYLECAPSATLRPFVERYWYVSADAMAESPGIIYPDGRIELVIPASGHMPLVLGATGKPLNTSPFGVRDLLGVRFTPAGATAILRDDAHRFTGRLLGLDDVCSPLARRLRSTVVDAMGVSTQVQSIERLLVGQLSKSALIDVAIARVAAVCDDENRSVAALAKVACLSTRQLERRFERTVGLSPKLYARIRRFHRASQVALQLEASPRWSELAAECGYFDQAHMNRDFQQFAELTPVELWRQHHGAFFQDRTNPAW